MPLRDDLTEKVNEFAASHWGAIPNARVIPVPEDLTFGNSGERMSVTVLYADVHSSTEMVDTLSDTMAAEYYKAFLHCSAKIIKSNSGEIEAYDGDRVMAIFVGENQADNAVRAALQINFAVIEIINPTFSRVYSVLHRALRHTVGIDSGTLLIAKTGVRVDSDLVWVGPAANYAAKLNSIDGSDPTYATRITYPVFAKLSKHLLYGADAKMMWAGPSTELKHDHLRSSYMIPIA